MSFDNLGLSPEALAAVKAAGYEKPTPIQEQAIPVVLSGRDIIGIAQTGTGKTASFCLPMIDRLAKGRARARMPRSLILEPTRELAAQVVEAFDKYGANRKLSVALLIGGVSFADQLAKLDRGVDVLIATPGRLLDHFERGKLLLTGIEILVIDEADRMLDMGFIPDVERICKLTPFTRQTLFFSATMPPEIQRLTESFLHNPVRAETTPPATAAETITQSAVHVRDLDKRDILCSLIRRDDVKNAIIFCNRKRDVATLGRALEKQGFSAAALHGDMDQRSRTMTLDGFRKGEVKFLVASDVAARGLDIPDVSHIFNFDVPVHAEDYVHRIGRTGRAGRLGQALTLVAPKDKKALAAIEKMLGKTLSVDALREFSPPLEEIAAPAPSAERSHDRAGARKRGTGRRERAPVAPAAREPLAPVTFMPSEHKPAPPRVVNRPPSQARQEHPDRKVTGLGDHVPAFLLRPVRAAQISDEEEALVG